MMPAIGRLWGSYDGMLALGCNPLGDAGVAAVAAALPPTVEYLVLTETGFGDDGMCALAAALSSHKASLKGLELADNPGVGRRGWRALVEALRTVSFDPNGCTMTLAGNPNLHNPEPEADSLRVAGDPSYQEPEADALAALAAERKCLFLHWLEF